MSKKLFWVVARFRLPQRLKSMLIEKFSGPLCSKKFQTILILAFEANSVLSHENETQIVKITYSAVVDGRGIGSSNHMNLGVFFPFSLHFQIFTAVIKDSSSSQVNFRFYPFNIPPLTTHSIFGLQWRFIECENLLQKGAKT